jgi:hypothetical protein
VTPVSPNDLVDRQYWVWVRQPWFYQDERGVAFPDLDPERGYTPEDWWSCSPWTRDGDLAVMYRSRERKDISHLVAARSDAWRLDDSHSPYHGTSVCKIQILARFPRPLALAEMRADPTIREWAALRAGFRKGYFPVPNEVWARLLELLEVDATKLQRTLLTGDHRFRFEKDLKRWILGGGQPLARLGYELDLRGDEYPCGSGRADIVYTEHSGVRQRWVVVELKRDTVGMAAVNQVRGYRDYLDKHRRRYRRTKAILVGDKLDDAAESALRWDPRLKFISIKELQDGAAMPIPLTE